MLEVNARVERAGFRLEIADALDAPVTGLFGPSGAGKTTLLRLIAGLERPRAGRVVLDGRILVDTDAGVFVPPHRRGVGFVFQDARLFPHLTVRGNLRFSERLGPKDGHRPSFASLIKLLELGPLLARRPAALSGGERQRVALGRALLGAPRLLLLDEPLAGLDRGRRRAILPYLARLRALTRVPIVYVSHDLAEILQLTDRLLVLMEGRSLGQGNFLDLVMRPEILECAHDLGLLNVIAARIHRQEPGEGLSHLAVDSEGRAPRLIAPWRAGREGDPASIALRPEDIALVLEPVHGISMQNQIEAHIERIVTTPSRVLCLARVTPGFRLLVEVTHHAIHTMGLAAGARVICLFKAQAVRYLEP